jgi:Peptidase family S41
MIKYSNLIIIAFGLCWSTPKEFQALDEMHNICMTWHPGREELNFVDAKSKAEEVLRETGDFYKAGNAYADAAGEEHLGVVHDRKNIVLRSLYFTKLDLNPLENAVLSILEKKDYYKRLSGLIERFYDYEAQKNSIFFGTCFMHSQTSLENSKVLVINSFKVEYSNYITKFCEDKRDLFNDLTTINIMLNIGGNVENALTVIRAIFQEDAKKSPTYTKWYDGMYKDRYTDLKCAGDKNHEKYILRKQNLYKQEIDPNLDKNKTFNLLISEKTRSTCFFFIKIMKELANVVVLGNEPIFQERYGAVQFHQILPEYSFYYPTVENKDRMTIIPDMTFIEFWKKQMDQDALQASQSRLP